MKDIRHLLVVNMNQLGDTLFTTPALALLRARFPDARIDVQTSTRAATLLQDNRDFDRLFVRPPRQGWARNTALARTLREGSYDAVVLFQSNLTYAMLVAAARIPIRAGFAQNGCGRFLTHPVPPRGRGEHIADSYVRLTEVFGSPAGGGIPRLKTVVTAQDAAFAEAFWRSHEITQPVAGLVIGTTRPQKAWPEEYWVHLADRLWQSCGVTGMLLGGPEEAEAAQRIQAQVRSPLLSAVGSTEPGQLAALIARCAVVVSGDTGPLHIATALQTPVVALFGSTDPVETGPWTRDKAAVNGVVLYDALPCAPCGKEPTCGGRFDCMRSLVPERVLDAVNSALGRPPRLALPMAVSPKGAG